ncbi:MAG: glycosyltransferase [Candidatus Pacebacteria bacterium]|jgi:glycosyltransferase involved in cell wall biosynthesis|nr:glycosyltransferase [Candidatus Paceibacterota bacterium]
MKFIHLTVKRFNASSADSIYISHLICQFNRHFGEKYQLIAGDKSPEQFNGVNVINLRFRSWKNGALHYWLPYVYYFFWFPYFLFSQKTKRSEIIFFSSDVNVLVLSIWWKKVLRCRFKVCSDWHLLFNNFKDGFVARNSDYLITTSEKLKKGLITRTGVDAHKIMVVYGGVDLSNYQNPLISRFELGLPEDKTLVGYVGLFKTMGMEKGVNTMIEALQYLDKETVMVFVGARGEQKEEYGKITETFHVENRCIFIDMQPTEKMPQYEKAMDMLVIPYPDKPHFREFGFPMKVYEYMASGKPIIYSKLDLAEEVIGDCAIGFEADNAKDLAEKITEAKKNKEKSLELAKMAETKVKDYTWQKKAERILECLK